MIYEQTHIIQKPCLHNLKKITVLLIAVMRVLLIAAICLLIGAAWWYTLPVSEILKIYILIFEGLFGLGVIVADFTRNRWRSRIALSVAFVLTTLWWMIIAPSNDRIWKDELSRTVHGDVNGNIVTLYNIRDFTWHGSDKEYDQKWATQAYDLESLDSVDLFLSSWSSPLIAHTLVSFGFDDGRHVVFSVSIRKEHDEEYSPVAGFFKQYELALLAGQERDMIYLRTNIRKEDVSLYRIHMNAEQRRALFLSYVRRGNALRDNPEFYNTITENCTTVPYQMIKTFVPGLPADYRVLFSGLLPSYIYDLGGFGHDLSFEELQSRAHISASAQGYAPESGIDFSEFIRQPVKDFPDDQK